MQDHVVVDAIPRRGTSGDVDAVAGLYVRARHAAVDIPAPVHSDDEIRRWIAARVVPRTELWVAETAPATLVGLLVLNEDCLDQLYVEPTLTGRGIGAELVRLASTSVQATCGCGHSRRTSEHSVLTSATTSSRWLTRRATTKSRRPTSRTSGAAAPACKPVQYDAAGAAARRGLMGARDGVVRSLRLWMDDNRLGGGATGWGCRAAGA